MRALNVIGLNSGTSMDGVDAALYTIRPKKPAGPSDKGVPSLEIELVGSLLHPFESSFQRRLQATVAAPSINWEQVCLLNVALGEVFADAALRLMRQTRSKVNHVDLIGSHGQTIWHAPTPRKFWGVEAMGTLQLGEPAVIAARTGVPVVADFRTADMAVGGQGAPLVSFADEVLFGRSGKPTAVLNIGGIANITVLNEEGLAILAFDTGPGNMIMDRAALRLTSQPFDQDGRLARSGRIDEKWLSELKSLAYFRQSPPKTTGRELFGFHFADELLSEANRRGLSAQDCLATLTALSAVTIARAYADFIEPRLRIDELVVGGGGADNSYLLDSIKRYWPNELTVRRHEDFGISTKFKEALLFALLAYTTFFKIPNNVPACTGASRRVCLGKLVQTPVGSIIGEHIFSGYRK
jgi:anhydro-N-acetylmuramic acid kinase